MSETQTTPADTTGTHLVTDKNGRVLEIRVLGLLEEMDLIELAGSPTPPERWMAIATFAACVRSIDGVPQPPLTPAADVRLNRSKIRQRVATMGPDGLRAVVKALAAEIPEGAADLVDGEEADPLAIAKN